VVFLREDPSAAVDLQSAEVKDHSLTLWLGLASLVLIKVLNHKQLNAHRLHRAAALLNLDLKIKEERKNGR
jgi:hypothetical protein